MKRVGHRNNRRATLQSGELPQFHNIVQMLVLLIVGFGSGPPLLADERRELYDRYCVDCHSGPGAEANLDLRSNLSSDQSDATLIFETELVDF